MKSKILQIAALFLFGIGTPATVDAQQATSVAEILENVRAGRGENSAAIFLTTSLSPSLLDELAEGLTAIAIDGAGATDPQSAALSAVSGLGSAGRGSFGRAYPRAIQELKKIVDLSSFQPVQIAALTAIASISRPLGQSLSILSEVAARDDILATVATRYLHDQMGPPGLARLRGLYRDGSATHPAVIQSLSVWAGLYGWR